MLISELQNGDGVLEVVFDVVLYLFEDFAFDVLSDFLRLVPALLQALVEDPVLAPQQNYYVEVLGGKSLRVLEIEQQAACCYVVGLGDMLYDEVVVELWDFELLVPFCVEFVFGDEFGDG